MLFYPCPLGFRNLEEEITDIMEVVLTRQMRKYRRAVLSLYIGFYNIRRDLKNILNSSET